MQIVGLQKRRDHDTSLAGAAAFVTVLTVATLTSLPAQPATAQGAVPCTAIADDDERLACYDRALRSPPPAAPAPRAAPAAAAQPTATPAPARTATPAAAPAPAATPAEVAREPRRESAAPAAPAAGNAEDPEIIPIVVVGVRALPGRETTFTASDGTSWVQTDSQRIVGLPDAPFEAEIKRGAIGSYFLLPADRVRAIRVRPLR